MNYSGLQTLYFEDATAQCIFDHFAAQKRNQRVSVVSRLVLLLRKEGRKVSPSKVGSVLKKMSAIGCGKFIKGESVGESRFEWNMQSRVAGIVASGESPITAEEIEEELGPFDKGIDVGVINAVVTHTF